MAELPESRRVRLPSGDVLVLDPFPDHVDVALETNAILVRWITVRMEDERAVAAALVALADERAGQEAG